MAPTGDLCIPSHWDFFWLAAKVLGEEMPLWDRNRN